MVPCTEALPPNYDYALRCCSLGRAACHGPKVRSTYQPQSRRFGAWLKDLHSLCFLSVSAEAASSLTKLWSVNIVQDPSS